MKKLMTRKSVGIAALAAACVLLTACPMDQSKNIRAHTVFLIGVDISGSFKTRPVFNDALEFLSRYIYAHVNGLGGLAKAKQMFVMAIGGNYKDEPQAFHELIDFEGREVGEIRDDLKKWFAGEKTMLTDFNQFFESAAEIIKERNLILSPLSIIVISDGIVAGTAPKLGKDAVKVYDNVDLSELEFLSRNVTLRLLYTNGQAAQNWKKYVPRTRVRVWTVPEQIMDEWDRHLDPYESNMESQEKLLRWIREKVDYRARVIRVKKKEAE